MFYFEMEKACHESVKHMGLFLDFYTKLKLPCGFQDENYDEECEKKIEEVTRAIQDAQVAMHGVLYEMEQVEK